MKKKVNVNTCGNIRRFQPRPQARALFSDEVDDISSVKRVTRKFHVVVVPQQRQRNVPKSFFAVLKNAVTV